MYLNDMPNYIMSAIFMSQFIILGFFLIYKKTSIFNFITLPLYFGLSILITQYLHYTNKITVGSAMFTIFLCEIVLGATLTLSLIRHKSFMKWYNDFVDLNINKIKEKFKHE